MTNLIQGNRYTFTVIDDEDNKRSFTGEFRGYDVMPEYDRPVMIIWEDGNSSGNDYDSWEVVRAVKVA